MVGTTNFPGSLDSHSGGSPFGFAEAVNALATTLSASLGAADTTVNVVSNAGFPTRGYLRIGRGANSEVVSYTGVSGSTQFTGCTRGADGSTAAAHVSGTAVSNGPVAANHNDIAAAVVAVETQILTYGREQFLFDLLGILGDTRLLWLPKSTDTTTSTDESLTGRTLTHSTSLASRLTNLGRGKLVSFNGTSEVTTTPDTANLSFGTGSADSAFSIVALLYPTDTAAFRAILTKLADVSNQEYYLAITSADKLDFTIYDQSASASWQRLSDAVITQSAMTLLCATYSGAGGATAGANMALYQNGAAIASTASQTGTYVAMENLTSQVQIGRSLTSTGYFPGYMALFAICQKQLSASEVWALKRLVNSYYNLSL